MKTNKQRHGASPSKTFPAQALSFAGLLVCARLGAAEPVVQSADTFAKREASPVDTARDKNLYVVGYSHLDTQWRWSYPQVIREFIPNTFNNNFALFEKYPNYIFNFTGSRRYEMMQEYYPAAFAKVKEAVAEGRWYPAGSSVDESDAMVPSAESLVRHVLYGNNYFRREFGKASDEFMLPDCFGFPASLPSILVHCGVKGFSTQKLTWGSSVGIPFKVGVWQGVDGRSLVAALDPGRYTGKVTEDLSRSESWLERITHTGELSGAYVDYHYFGTGDKGGAPDENSVRMIERSLAGTGPVRVVSSNADQIFKDLKADQAARLPVYRGEFLLTEHSAGSISSQAYMKRWNRQNEQLADAAERVSVAAFWLGSAPYPAKKLYDAWDLVLGSQMHDMIPGTSIPKAYEYCWNDEIVALNQFSGALQDGVGAVAAGLDTRAEGIPLVVYNPLSEEREEAVEAELRFDGEAPSSVAVFGPDGKQVPTQLLRRDGSTLALLFPAKVPSVGFSVFDVRPSAQTPALAATLSVSERGLENAKYKVALDANGDLASIVDKETGRELLSSPARLAFQYEKPLQYPAWNMDWEDRKRAPRAYVTGPAKVRVVERGPVRVALEVEREAEGSRFVQTIRLGAGSESDRVEIACGVDWQTPESCLKAEFPFAIVNPLASYDSQIGVVQRGNNEPKKYEVPQHQWFDLTSTDHSLGAAVLNDSKYGSDKPDDHTLRLTLLYTPGVRQLYQDQATQDFGHHEFVYAVKAHRGDWREGGVVRSAARLNQPLRVFRTQAHAGALGRSFSLFQVDNAQVAISALKKAELSDEIVVRLRELSGRTLKNVTLRAATPVEAAREINGQEQPLGEAAIKDGGLAFDIEGFHLRAFALKLAKPAVSLQAPESRALDLPYDADVLSANAQRDDGAFDREGRSLPAEQFPASIVSDGVAFATGPSEKGRANALVARGQTLALPEGYERVYVLAASDGDAKGRFVVGEKAFETGVQNWSGYVGQWDNRLWSGTPEEIAFSWHHDEIGLEPGFVKKDSIAWFCSHRHSREGDEYYRYSYLFKYAFDIPAGARTLGLPDNPAIRIFAVSVARNVHDRLTAAKPLYDQLGEHKADAPGILPAPGRHADTVLATLVHPLYWNDGGLRYTVDGGEPTSASTVYEKPFALSRSAVVKARSFDARGRGGPIATASFEISDTTPPSLQSATAANFEKSVRLVFSEPLDGASARQPASYTLSPGPAVTNAELSEDGRSVTLRLAEPPRAGRLGLTIEGLRDASPARNALVSFATNVEVAKPVYRMETARAGQAEEIRVPGLPVGADKPWSMNAFVRVDEKPDNGALFAGFGRCDTVTGGCGRYFGIGANGLLLWTRRMEVESGQSLEIGKWTMLTAVYDGETLALYRDGIKIADRRSALSDDEAVIRVAPPSPANAKIRFGGKLRDFTVWNGALPAETIRLLLEEGKGRE